MPLTQATCPNCSGTVEVNKDNDAAICKFCGTPFIVEKAIQQFIVTHTTVNNIENAIIQNGFSAERYLENGITLIRLNQYQDAQETFSKMSKDYPGDWRSWFGLDISDFYSSLGSSNKLNRFANYVSLIPENYRNLIGDGKVYSEEYYTQKLTTLEQAHKTSRDTLLADVRTIQKSKQDCESNVKQALQTKSKCLQIIEAYQRNQSKILLKSAPTENQKRQYQMAYTQLNKCNLYIKEQDAEIAGYSKKIETARHKIHDVHKKFTLECQAIKKEKADNENNNTIEYYYHILEQAST